MVGIRERWERRKWGDNCCSVFTVVWCPTVLAHQVSYHNSN